MNERRKQEGLRTRFRAMLDPDRATWPRKSKTLESKRVRSILGHPIAWYVDGHLVERPLNAAYALAMFSEWCLAKIKAGKGGDLLEATAFYADTRRFMEMILRNRKAGRNLTAKQREGMRPRVVRLIEQARVVSSKIHR